MLSVPECPFVLDENRPVRRSTFQISRGLRSRDESGSAVKIPDIRAEVGRRPQWCVKPHRPVALQRAGDSAYSVVPGPQLLRPHLGESLDGHHIPITDDHRGDSQLLRRVNHADDVDRIGELRGARCSFPGRRLASGDGHESMKVSRAPCCTTTWPTRPRNPTSGILARGRLSIVSDPAFLLVNGSPLYTRILPSRPQAHLRRRTVADRRSVAHTNRGPKPRTDASACSTIVYADTIRSTITAEHQLERNARSDFNLARIVAFAVAGGIYSPDR